MARKLAVRLYWMWLKELYCGRGIGVAKNGELRLVNFGEMP